MRRVADALPASSLPIFDVGSGTGIFTRQIAALLPSDAPIVGVETAAAMRAEAAATTHMPNILWRDGAAEALPCADQSARAILAATAAHWFDRPRFYAEAARALAPGGLLGIVEYVRDPTNAAARAIIDFLDRFGEARAYARPEYEAELASLPEFESSAPIVQAATLRLSPDDYAGLALSSSHARKAVETLGRAGASALLRDAGEQIALGGLVQMGYVFQAFLAHRR